MFLFSTCQGFPNGAGEAKQINKKCLKVVKAFKTKRNENNIKMYYAALQHGFELKKKHTKNNNNKTIYKFKFEQTF
jgi:hypothetical protein